MVVVGIGVISLVELMEKEEKEREMKNRAVIVLSGGMDSTVCSYIAAKKHRDLYFISFDYGQRHRKELVCAEQTVRNLGGKDWKLVTLDFNQWMEAILLGQGDLPKGKVEGIAPTWVPQRNSIFLAIAFSYAEFVNASSVYIGVSQMDYSGYPDCREEFINSIEDSLNLAAGRPNTDRILIEAPLMHIGKDEEVKIGEKLKIPWIDTWTCYAGGEEACGVCPACCLRKEAFEKAGVVDPIVYASTE